MVISKESADGSQMKYYDALLPQNLINFNRIPFPNFLIQSHNVASNSSLLSEISHVPRLNFSFCKFFIFVSLLPYYDLVQNLYNLTYIFNSVLHQSICSSTCLNLQILKLLFTFIRTTALWVAADSYNYYYYYYYVDYNNNNNISHKIHLLHPKTTLLGIYHVFRKFLNRGAQLLTKCMLILIKPVIASVIVKVRV